MEWDGLTPLRHFVQTQAGNMGLCADHNPRPERFEAKDLPALVRYADGSFAVIEKRRGRKLEAWNKNAFVMANSAKGWSNSKIGPAPLTCPLKRTRSPF
jgi:hypothetical protein